MVVIEEQEMTINIHFQTTTWMKPMTVINPTRGKMIYYLYGHVDENTEVVVEGGDGGRGGSRMYCIKHQAIYMPTGQCPYCNGKALPEAEVQASVTGCDTPKF
jgi:hypothetical protein